MAIFSTNQVRHLYVVKDYKGDSVKPENIETELVNAGDIAYMETPDNDFYFSYKDADSVLRSDLVKKDWIRSIKLTEGKGKKKHTTVVKLSDEVNEGKIIPGQDYILNIHIRQYLGISDKETTIKFGAVRGTKNMEPNDFYKKMAISLAKNFSREVEDLLYFYVGGEEVKANTTMKDLEKVTATELTIKEADSEWIRGLKEETPVYYEVQPTTIYEDGNEVIWGTKEDTYAEEGNNYHDIANLEYFCKGERGDIYRNMGWPKVIPQTYLVNEDDFYDVIDIAYYLEEPGENPQKSEKVMTLVGVKGSLDDIASKLEELPGFIKK